MNRYHETHPDPEIRQKFQEWQSAMWRYRARSAGFNSKSEMDDDTKRREKTASLRSLLNILPVKGQNTKKTTTKQTHKRMLRTSGQRGS